VRACRRSAFVRTSLRRVVCWTHYQNPISPPLEDKTFRAGEFLCAVTNLGTRQGAGFRSALSRIARLI
jgi:hypothetical protein